jgi:hypothetical protein
MPVVSNRDSDTNDVNGYENDAPQYDYAYSRDRSRRMSGQCDWNCSIGLLYKKVTQFYV